MEEDLLTLFEFDDSWDLTSVEASREACGGDIDVKLTFTNGSEFKQLILFQCSEYEIVEALLYAEYKVRVSKILNTQREFGRICIECHTEDSYSYYTCNKVIEGDSNK